MKKYILFIALLSLIGCKKQNEWLDTKSSKSSVVPETIKDFQAILDHGAFINEHHINAGLVSADNITIPSADIEGLFEQERNAYLWNKQIWAGGISTEWNNYFRAIELANLVLEGLTKLNPAQPGYSNVKGQAYFHRAFNYYHLAQLFCKPYNAATVQTDLGLPIRLTPDVGTIAQRSSLSQLYDQMVSDALAAESLLPTSQIYLQRPPAIAAKGLLAKIYVVKQDYANAGKLSDEVLKLKPALLDYNNESQVSESLAYKFVPYAKDNPEVFFYAEGKGYISTLGFAGNVGYVSPDLFNTYGNDDLRKTTLFGANGVGYNYVASYTGSFNVFFGLATNEMYFIRAECLARSGNFHAAIDDVNQVLLHRYREGTFTPLQADNMDEAMLIILTEKRKEFPNVGNIRWEDLRRLNLDPKYQITLERNFNGQSYKLLPNDPRYVLPIPDQEIQLSGIQQNER